MGKRRSVPPNECGHAAPVVVSGVRDGYVARCLLCYTLGPVRATSDLALQALRDLAAEDPR